MESGHAAGRFDFCNFVAEDPLPFSCFDQRVCFGFGQCIVGFDRFLNFVLDTVDGHSVSRGPKVSCRLLWVKGAQGRELAKELLVNFGQIGGLVAIAVSLNRGISDRQMGPQAFDVIFRSERLVNRVPGNRDMPAIV